MKKLLNTLYVTSENSYLGLDGENIVVFEDNKEEDFRYIIWRESFLLDTVVSVRHLWELVQKETFRFVL